MEEAYRDYGREAIHNFVFTNPEIYELFKPDLDGKFEEGLRKGERKSKLAIARNLHRMGVAEDVIFRATGLNPDEYL